MKDTDYKYVVWVNYGYEGWRPTGFNTLKECVLHTSYGYEKVITFGAINLEEVIKEPTPPTVD